MRLSDRLDALSEENLAALERRLDPLPAAIRRIWTASVLSPDPSAYNVVECYDLTGSMDPANLGAALNSVYERHRVLRMVVVDRFSPPRATFLPASGGFPFEFVDAREQGEGDRSAMVEEFAARSFDLANGPLVAALLLRSGDEQWRLCLNMHHLVCDGRTLQIFLDEVSEHFAGRGAALDPPTDGFAAMARLSVPGDREDDLHYWKTELEGVPESLAVDATQFGGDRMATSAERISIPIPAETLALAKERAAAASVSLFEWCLTATTICLARQLSTADDIMVGTTVDRRDTVAADDALGFFMSTVPLRMRCRRDQPVSALLHEARHSVVGALSHHEVDFDGLVTAIGRSGEGAQALFPVALEVHHGAAWRLGDLLTESVLVKNAGNKFDLSLHLSADGGPHYLEFATGVISHLVASSFADSFVAVLQEMNSDLSKLVEDVRLLSERAALQLASMGHPVASVPTARPLPVEVQGLALGAPDLPAVSDAPLPLRNTVTFGQLTRRAWALAHQLVDAGVQPGDAVAIHLPRGVGQIVALFAIWGCRGVAVPVDRNATRGRLASLLSGVGCRHAITESSRSADELPPGVQSWALQDSRRMDLYAPPRISQPEDIAYAIFTSGSTGIPKAVAVTHESLSSFSEAMDALVYSDLPSRSIVAMNAPLVFDASLQAVQLLRHGHHVVVVDEGTRTDAQEFVEFLRKCKVASVDAVPTHVEALRQAGLLEGTPAVPHLVIGGEAVSADLWQALASSPTAAFNVYGPTEATINATAARISEHELPTIGRPLPGVEVRILDGNRQVLPAGMPGELHVSGTQVACGYLSNPAATAAQFWVGEDGDRWYATGDIARWTADGTLQFLGRRDSQVKIRGFRIELEEVEAALSAAAGTSEAIVIPFPAERPTHLLGALAGAHGIDFEKVLQDLGQTLPAHAVPHRLAALDRVPLLPNGKLDRRGAVALALEHLSAPATDTALDHASSKLAALWDEVLPDKVVKRSDDFFALGGTSLSLTRLIRRIRQEYGVAPPPHQVFRARTLGEMSDLLNAGRSGARTGPASPILVSLKHGSGRPLILIHPLGGGLTSYGPLLSLLSRCESPVLGIQSVATAGADREPDDVQTAIRMYARAVEEFGVADGVNLLGWSLGGLVAVALAAELESRGIEVGWCELWDCGLGTSKPYSEAELEELVARPAQDDPRTRQRHMSTIVSQTSWFDGWVPDEIRADLHVVYAAQSVADGSVTLSDWRSHTSGVVVERHVLTDHYGMVDFPSVRHSAEGLMSRLAGGRR